MVMPCSSFHRSMTAGFRGLAGRDRVPDPGEVRPLQFRGLGEETILCRRLAEDGYAVPTDKPQALGRVEAAVVEEELRSEAPRAEKDVPDALGPPGPGGAPEPVPFPQIEPELGLHPLGVGVAVGVEHALRVLGSARGVEDERAVLGGRVLWLELL